MGGMFILPTYQLLSNALFYLVLKKRDKKESISGFHLYIEHLTLNLILLIYRYLT